MDRVEFHFDFGSPNAYLAHAVLPAIQQRTRVPITYVPILLGGVFKATGNRSPGEAFGAIRNKPEYLQLEIQRFIRRHNIQFRWNPHFPINTLMVMRGALAAQETGQFEHYVNEMFRHLWVEGAELDDPDVLRDTLTESGIDAERIFALSQEPHIKQQLIENTEQSVERGCFGAPTFFVGQEIYFGKDSLIELEEALKYRSK